MPVLRATHDSVFFGVGGVGRERRLNQYITRLEMDHERWQAWVRPRRLIAPVHSFLLCNYYLLV